MKKLTAKESQEIVKSFLETLKKGMKRKPVKIEFFELTLTEPYYEKLNCAYVQTSNLKEGILYEGITNRFIYLKSEKGGTPVLSDLVKSVGNSFPKIILDKMFWVCGNKKDKELELIDFGEVFKLVKPEIK